MILLPFFLGPVAAHAQEGPVALVDQRIGTWNDGSFCFIGPQLPFASINPGPQTPEGGNDGYNPTQPVRGFGQLHVSGTGWGKYGQVFVSPQTGLAVGEQDHDSPKENETAHPWAYGVTLSRYGIRTEVSPSLHSAIYRFIFPASDSAHVLIDLSHNIPRDIATNIGGEIREGRIDADSAGASISGYGVYTGGFGSGEYTVYFKAVFDRVPGSTGTWKNGTVTSARSGEEVSAINDRVGAFFRYRTMATDTTTTGDTIVAGDTLMMKIAVSFRSIDQAGAWLDAEIPDFGYGAVRSQAIDAWNDKLSRITIEGADETRQKIFYTALYHSMLMPRDRTGDMKGFAEGAPVWDDQYAVWDTWRTLFPLMVLVDPDMVAGTVNSFAERLRVNGRVRDAFIAGNDMAEEQGGNDVDNIIADAIVKGVKGIDTAGAWQVIAEHAEGATGRTAWQGWGNPGISDPVAAGYRERGWVPAGTMSCSYSLEYSYNDYCAGLVAGKLGREEKAAVWLERSTGWSGLWDSAAVSDGYSGFIVPRSAGGNFIDIDLKKYWGSWNDYFYEGNAWTYSFFVPHQLCRLVNLCGGPATFTGRLRHGLDYGLIGLDNEPAFLVPMAFIHAGRPGLTSRYVRKLLEDGFTATGLPGNDDSGAMSSWCVFATLGFFPNAGQGFYYLFGPSVPRAVIELDSGNELVIEAENDPAANPNVQSCTLNGRTWDHAWIPHDSIAKGAVIRFVMGSDPSSWAENDTLLCTHEYSVPASNTGIRIPSVTPIRAWPNPFGDSIRLEAWIGRKVKSAIIGMYDVTGGMKRSLEIGGRGMTSTEVDAKELPPGMYYLVLRVDGQTAGAGKIIKY